MLVSTLQPITMRYMLVVSAICDHVIKNPTIELVIVLDVCSIWSSRQVSLCCIFKADCKIQCYVTCNSSVVILICKLSLEECTRHFVRGRSLFDLVQAWILCM